MSEENTLNLPNVLSGLRLLSVPLMLYFGWTHQPRAFLLLFALALVTDGVDGFIARKMHTVTSTGARLDSVADFSMYAALVTCAWWLWPDIFGREAAFVFAAVVGWVSPILVGVLRFGRLTSFHTWGAKLSAVVMGGSVLILVTGGPSWPFRTAVPIMILAGLEEIAITMILAEWRADVPSFRHALRIRQQRKSTQR